MCRRAAQVCAVVPSIALASRTRVLGRLEGAKRAPEASVPRSIIMIVIDINSSHAHILTFISGDVKTTRYTIIGDTVSVRQKKGTPAATGETVRVNIRRLREANNLGYAELAEG